jgi:hypothetical protein
MHNFWLKIQFDWHFWVLLFMAGFPLCAKTVTIYPPEDSLSMLRNPATGWVLYGAENGNEPDSSAYWSALWPEAVAAASIFYVRTLWSKMEPSEGRYAWNENARFKSLVQGAVDRGLTLAFRIYVTSQDVPQQATPEWVFQAGSKSYATNNGKSPYPDDPVFQDKFARFIEAFGAKYNNPRLVSFVDGNGLGWWGEEHHIVYQNSANRTKVLQWLNDSYRKAFPDVLLAENFPNGGWSNAVLDSISFVDRAYGMRRDGLASKWVTPQEKLNVLSRWPRLVVFGENCYYGFSSNPNWYRSEGGYGDLRQLMRALLDDGLSLHANTLDLRMVRDANDWMSNPDYVQEWIRKGGYRLLPTSITFEDTIASGRALTIKSIWKNAGSGIFPNGMKAWKQKYKPAFALIPAGTGKNPILAMDTVSADPGTWVKGQVYDLSTVANFSVATGAYQLAVGIVDRTSGDASAIKLALSSPKTSEGWYEIGEVFVRLGTHSISDNLTGNRSLIPSFVLTNRKLLVVTAKGTRERGSGVATLFIRNLNGQVLASWKCGPGENAFNLGRFPYGKYTCELHFGARLYRQVFTLN